MSEARRPLLIIFGGLPGAGKTTIAGELGRQIGAVYLRIDSIEQALRDALALTAPLEDAGYRVAYAIAGDNLRAGRTVIADSVNPLDVTRHAWRAVAAAAPARAVEVEILCSDPREHRRRVETRTSDVAGLALPIWEEVTAREYHPWPGDHIVIDTAGRSVEECVGLLRESLRYE
jgi:predicted kinase